MQIWETSSESGLLVSYAEISQMNLEVRHHAELFKLSMLIS